MVNAVCKLKQSPNRNRSRGHLRTSSYAIKLISHAVIVRILPWATVPMPLPAGGKQAPKFQSYHAVTSG